MAGDGTGWRRGWALAGTLVALAVLGGCGSSMSPVQGELEVGVERVPYELYERSGQFCMALGARTDRPEPDDVSSGPQPGAFCGAEPTDEFPVVLGAAGGGQRPAGQTLVDYRGSVFGATLLDVAGLRLQVGDREVEPELREAPGGEFRVFALVVEGQYVEDELPEAQIISVERVGS